MTVAIVQAGALLDLIAASRFGDAVAALGDRWPGLAVDPGEGSPHDLLAIGVLNSNLGFSEQRAAAQEVAKNCLSRASRALRGDERDICDVQLSLAYWRAGDEEEALIQLSQIVKRELSPFTLFRALLAHAVVLGSLARHKEESECLSKARPLLDFASDAFKGRFHLEAGYNCRRLGGDTDQCLTDYTAALVYFEKCEALMLQASTRNNIAGVYLDLGSFDQAHRHIEKAIEIGIRAGDKGRLSQYYDQQALIFLAQGQPVRAAQCAHDSIRLSAGVGTGWAIDSRITYAKSLARIGNAAALDEFSTAIQIARRQANQLKETEAALTALEETEPDSRLMLEWFLLADRSDNRKRVTAVLRKVANKLGELADYEDVKLAMIEHKGNIKHAAKSLGYNHHTGLLPYLNKHPELRLKKPYKRSKR